LYLKLLSGFFAGPVILPSFRLDTGGMRYFINEGETSTNNKSRYMNMKFIIFNSAHGLPDRQYRDPFQK